MAHHIDSLTDGITALRAEGYTEDFNQHPDCLVCRNGEIRIYPQDFQIDKYFHYEGESDPADNVVLYGISSEKHGVKGVLVNGYGIYSDDAASETLRKLRVDRPG